MKTLKKILCSLLVVIMCLTAAPLDGFVGFNFKAEASDYKVGDIIEFGSYPQALVNGEALNNIVDYWDKWNSYGYYAGESGSMVQGDWMRYIDVVYNGKKYRGVAFKNYRPYSTTQNFTNPSTSTTKSYQYENGYQSGKIYWFVFQPIKWRVLDPSTGLAMCETIIDSQPYNNTIYGAYNDAQHTSFASNYENSSIRQWLNYDFYNTAFTASEKKEINATLLNNRSYPTTIGELSGEQYDSNETKDKIFLLSYSESQKNSYGFSTSRYDEKKEAKSSSYAKCMGLDVSDSWYAEGNSMWLLRSASDSTNSCYIDIEGGFCRGAHVTKTYYGIRPALRLSRISGVVEPDNSFVDEETEAFYEEHIKFAQDKTLVKMLDDYSFHNNVDIKKRILNSYYAWEIIGDIGETLTFKIDDWIINADYYEMYLADMVLNLNSEEKKDDLEWKLAKGYKEVSGILLNLFKSSDELDDGLDDNFYNDMAELFSGKEFKLSNGTTETLKKLLGDHYKNNKKSLETVFELLSGSGKVLDLAFKGGDILNGFLDVYNSYVIAKAFYEINDEFFNVCKEAGRILYNDTSKKEYKDYARWFLNAVDDAESNMLGSFDAFFDMIYTAMLETGKITWESLFQDVVKAVIYPAIGKIIGLTGGQFNVLTTTYNTTFWILDAAFGHGEAGDKYRIMNYVTPVEKALQTVVSSRRSNLLNSTEKDEDIAIKYDIAYQIHRQTNMYLYENAYRYAAIKNYQEDMETITTLKHRWNILRCHYRVYGDEYTLFSAHCPVDVYVYDNEGNLVTSIVDEKITMMSPNVTVMNSSGNKTVAYPSELEYSFIIKAREEGTMDYSISKGTANKKLIDYKSYDIPLTENQEFSINVPVKDASETDYKLNTEETKVDFDYNYTDICETHSYGEWSDEGECKSRKCSICGYIDQEVICLHKSGSIKAYSIVPTCTTSGHTINICTDCGATLSDGEDIVALGHEKSKLIEKIEATCTSKGYEFYECDYCDGSFVITIDKKDHELTEWTQSKIPTCKEEGEETRGCENCSYTERNLISVLDHSYTSKITKPTCTVQGFTTYTCECGETYTRDYVSATGHKDDNNDYKCDNACGYEYEKPATENPSDNCSCNCHKGGTSGFFFKIILFFQKIFKSNKTCACGVNHY